MTPPESPPESTPEQPGTAVAARHGTQPATEPASTEEDSRTPEARLLARRRLGTAYLEDVRSLIARAERADALVEEAEELLREQRGALNERDSVIAELAAEVERLGGQKASATREFGTIRTAELRDG